MGGTVAGEQDVIELLDEITSKDEAIRFRASNEIVELCERDPGVVAPHWSRIVGLLDSPNAYHRSIALHLVARLCGHVPPAQFEATLERFLALFDDGSLMVARYAVGDASRIIEARPDIRGRVIEALLAIDRTRHPLSRKELLKSDVIALLGSYVDDAEPDERAAIVAFVRAQASSPSPKTRAAAKAFERSRG